MLKDQLNILKRNQKSLPSLPYKAQPSLLFDFKYTNIIGIDDVYEIGYEGLIELSKINDKFIKYLKLLFSSTSKYFNRELIPQNEIKEYDKNLKELLIDLSEYFSNKNTHQIIEYLLKVYKVNLYLTDDYLIPFLCYYNNKIFIKLLQNINFNENKQWIFLENFAKNGVIIPNDIINKYCSSNLEFITKIIYYYIENISLNNEKYFMFILDIIQYKLNNFNSLKNELDKNLFQLIIKLINYINKNYQLISNNNTKEYNYILSYFNLVKAFINKINIEYIYLKGMANDLIINILTYITEENSFYLLILLLSLICKSYNNYHLNNEYIFNESSIKVFSDKYALFENLNDKLKENNTNENNIEYLAYEFISCTVLNSNFNLINDFLCPLFSDELITEKIIYLLFTNNKKFKSWNVIEDLNSKNFNLAFISLYKNNKINNIPLKNNNINLYFNLISSSVPQVMNAINECSKNINLVNNDNNILNALSSKFIMFDEEIILNAILSIKNFNLQNIGKELLSFYYQIIQGKNHSYSNIFISKIQNLLNNIYQNNNEKFNIYKNIFFNDKKITDKTFNYNKKTFINLLNDVITYNKDSKNEKLNLDNILSMLDLYFQSPIEDENELNLIESIITNNNTFNILIKNYKEIFDKILKNYIVYIKNIDIDNKLKRLITLCKFMVNDYKDYNCLNELINIHFKDNDQIFYAYLLFELDNKASIVDLINYIIDNIKSNNNKIQFLLYIALLLKLPYSSNLFDNSIKLKFNFSNFESILTNNKNKNKTISTKEIKEYEKILKNFNQAIIDEKIELKINKNYLNNLFQSNKFDIENLYLLTNQILLSYQNTFVDSIIYKVLSLFSLNKTHFDISNNNNKEKFLSFINKNINDENNTNNTNNNIINLLIKNYINFYPKSETEIIFFLKNKLISNEIIDILFKEEFDINKIKSPEELFILIDFCINNSITPFKLNLTLPEKKINEYLNYIINNDDKINQNQIVYLYKIIVLLSINNCMNNSSIINNTFLLIKNYMNKNNNEIDINLCYAIYSLTKKINKDILSIENANEILNNLFEIFKKLVSLINIENTLNYELEKKIELILNTTNNICSINVIDNNILIDIYNYLKENELSKLLKNELFNILFNSIIEFINNDSIYTNIKDDLFYYKYLIVIIKHQDLEYNNEILYKLSKCKINQNHIKCISFFIYKLYATFKHNRIEILNKYILNNDYNLLFWAQLIEEIINLNDQYIKIKIMFDLVNNIVSYLSKKDFTHNNDNEQKKQISISILNILTKIFISNKDLTNKLISFCHKQKLTSFLFIMLYDNNKNNHKLYSTSKNFILKNIINLINLNDYPLLYDFTLNEIIINNLEKKYENLIYIYQLLIRVTNNSHIDIIKKYINNFIELLNNDNNKNDLVYSLYYFTLCKYIAHICNNYTMNFLNYFNSFMPKFLSSLKKISDIVKSNKDLRDIIYEIFNILTMNLCEYLSPFLNEILSILITLNINENETKLILDKIAKKTLFDVSFNSIKDNKDNMNNLLLYYFNSSIESADKLVITDIYLDIIKVICDLLFNYQNYFNDISNCIRSFILKINEKILKKIFDYLLQILNTKDDNREYKVNNCIIIFEIFNSILNTLRDLFVENYYNKYKNIQIQIMKLSSALAFKKTENLSEKKLNKKREREVEENNNFTYYKLLCLLLENIKLNFKYSKGNIISEIVEDLIDPIIDQFKLCNNDKNKMINYFNENLKDCVCEMFLNIKDNNLFKEFNDEILNLIREESYITRYISIQMIYYLLEQVKERYIILVADIVPYIADSLEDSNELVQKEAVKTIEYIERLTGEKYQTYLD